MKEITKKNKSGIIEEINKETMEMARMKVELSVNSPKDTNVLGKRKRHLARLKTALSMNLTTK